MKRPYIKENTQRSIKDFFRLYKYDTILPLKSFSKIFQSSINKLTIFCFLFSFCGTLGYKYIIFQ